MSIKKTVILFIILVLMGAYYYTQVNLAEKQQIEEEAAKKLFDSSEDVIQEITLKRQNEEIVLKKQKETWKMIQPVEDSTDTDAVKRMVIDLVKAEHKKNDCGGYLTGSRVRPEYTAIDCNRQRTGW